MNTSPKRPLTVTKILRLACATFEILICVGLVVTAGMAPFAESSVASGSQVTIAKRTDTGNFMYSVHPSHHHDITVSNDPSGSHEAGTGGTGSVTVGPFALKAGKGEQFLKGPNADPNVSIQNVEASMTFKGPERAVEALRAFKWPAVAGEFLAILAGLAYFDALRRLLSSAEKGDLFTQDNVVMLRRFGVLIIVLDLAKFAATAVLTARMNSFVAPFLSDGALMGNGTISGKLTGVLSGVMLLLLAEVFREGLKFRKDSDLTI